MLEFFRWLVNSPWSHAINSYEWVFPVVQSLHFIGFAMSIGTIAIVDFRLLGLGMLREAPARLGGGSRALDAGWSCGHLITGPLMFSTDAVAYHYNPSFQFKMVCLTMALLMHFTLHRRAVQPEVPSIAAKLAAAMSLLLWTAVVAGGRMIAFI